MLAEIFTVLVLLALFMLPLVAGRLRDKLASFDAGRGAPQVGTPGGHGGSGHRPGRDLRGLWPWRQNLSSIRALFTRCELWSAVAQPSVYLPETPLP